MRKGIESAWWMLRIGLGLGPALAGLDKIFRTNLLADWPAYISPLATAVLPMSGEAFMQVVGVIELVVGIAILTVATRLGAWVAIGVAAAHRRQPRHHRHALRCCRAGRRNGDCRVCPGPDHPPSANRSLAVPSRSVSVTGHAVA